MRTYDLERFGVLFLDARHQVLHAEAMFRGTIERRCRISPRGRERALELNAAAIIVTHQHPSGIAELSESDRAITAKRAKALMTVEIRLLDHVVLGVDRAVSLAERGMIWCASQKTKLATSKCYARTACTGARRHRCDSRGRAALAETFQLPADHVIRRIAAQSYQ